MQRRLLFLISAITFTLSLFFLSNKVLADNTIQTPAQLYFPSLNTVAGNPQGKVSVVEFFDYNCEYCHLMPRVINQVLSSNNNVRVVYRDYPVLAPSSMYAARAALAAAMQGKYMPLHNALFATHDSLSDSNVITLANSAGINTQQMLHNLTSAPVNAQLRANAADAQQLGIQGIPVIVVAPTPVKGKSVTAIMLVSPSVGDLQAAIHQVSGQ
jgi:protein-disulfide isomerase